MFLFFLSSKKRLYKLCLLGAYSNKTFEFSAFSYNSLMLTVLYKTPEYSVDEKLQVCTQIKS